MKGLRSMTVGLVVVLVAAVQADAGLFGSSKKKAAEQTNVEEQAAPAKQETTAAEKKAEKAREAQLKNAREQQQKKLAELNNTEWQIEMTPLSGKGKKEIDTVTFSANQVAIAGYVKKGFAATNFTLTVQEDGMVVWETMQTSDKAGTAFWRGEVERSMQTMRGIVSYQVDDKTKHDFSFISTARKAIPAAGK